MVLIALTDAAKRRVLMVSPMDSSAGEMLASMWVFELPASESLSNQVSLDALKGMPPEALALVPRLACRSLNSLMTRASALKPLLIAQPCFMTKPSECTFDCRSAPARSTRLIFECSSVPPSSPRPGDRGDCAALGDTAGDFGDSAGDPDARSSCWILTLKTACEREEWSFMAVAAMARRLVPKSNKRLTSSGDSLGTWFKPGT
mmetsp:Transcript_90251/g.260101  ORF Transcript_90251/g.260101 Transcript_90251/m.260101 type:complete len:204 (+) Transcript_90251:620-1231(+)